MNIGILLVRLAVGLTLTAHGTQMLFGWFGGLGLNSTGQFFEERLGFHPGSASCFSRRLGRSRRWSSAGAWVAHAPWSGSRDQCHGGCRFKRPNPEGFLREK